MFLDWDNQARILLPKVYMEEGDFAAAVGAYDKLFTMSPTARDNPDVQWSFRTALLKAKQYDKLETQLNDVIMKGPRPDAARAQIMRGDIRMAQNQIEPAALDYLRTVVLFKAEADYQAEAMFKAADALEKLRDGRAKDWYRKVVEQYPQSPYAAQARAKL
jgi:TolA-binding protein